MDMLRNLFGNLTAGIIRLLVTVGILAAAYFFIVKPVLRSANDAIESTNSSFEKSFGNSGLDDLDKALEDVGRQVKIQVTRSFHAARKHGNPKKLLHCVEGAEGNAHRIRRCAVKY
jgi:predicted PurR-regulated permease PerM